MGSGRNFSCFLNTILYKEKHHFYHNELTESLSCAFDGTIKVGALRFKTKTVQLRIGKCVSSKAMIDNATHPSEGSIELVGKLTEPQNSTFGIFKHSSSCPSIRLLFDQNTAGYIGSFCAVSNMFGIKKLVNVSISENKLTFKLHGKLHNRFDASMHCSSRVSSWQNQVFDVTGKFEANTEGTDFVSILMNQLEAYAIKSISQAMRRLKTIEKTVERARAKRESAVLLHKLALKAYHKLSNEYTVLSEHWEAAKRKLRVLEKEAGNFSKSLEELKLKLETLCQIERCNELCQEGVYCAVCYEDVFENSRRMCPATCMRTEQRLIPPYTEVVYCDREKCKRIHNTNGLFKRLFGDTFGRLIKMGLSFGISAVATALGAPPPVSSALGSGIVTLLDTGRVDEVLCSAAKGFLGGAIGGKSPLSVYKKVSKVSKRLAVQQAGFALGRKGLAAGVNKLISCQREQKDGYWKCKVTKIQCEKGRYEYQYEQYPYECKKSCVVKTIKKTIEKSCCKRVPCAFLIVNATCLGTNAICKRARLDALKTIAETKSEAMSVLKELMYTRSNVSYLNMKMKKRYNMLLRQERWLNMTRQTAHSLQTSYNSSIQSKKQVENLLSRPLKIRWLFDEHLTSAVGIKLIEISLRAKVFRGNRNLLLPIVITYEANGTQRQISTVFDFQQVNTSLRSISEEILIDISRNVFSNSRKRRSVKNPTPHDAMLLSLKKYHSYCAKFTNYHEILNIFAQSLYNLSSDLLIANKISYQRNYSIAISTFPMNRTMISYFGLEKTNYSRPEYYEDDLEISEAFMLEQEEIQRNDELLNSTTALLINNWFATVEDMFNSSRMNYECSGMNDCVKNILDEFEKMFFMTEGADDHKIQQEIKELEIELDNLSNSVDITAYDAGKLASRIFSFLKQITGMDLMCAQSPNITKHPKPFTEIGIGKTLVLYCNATGTSLLYSWELNGEIMYDQKSNVLKINTTTAASSGNYTCVVSNHIAKERSTPAVVVIHPPRTITEQPAKYLAIVLGEDDYLICKVEDNDNFISYKWWFKHATSSSQFTVLPNETFSHLSFSPMNYQHEGWYYCQVSNVYGTTMSQKSFVKALSFTLPVPLAVLSFSLNSRKHEVNSSINSSNSSSYDDISSHIVTHILARENFTDGVHVENLKVVDCELPKGRRDKRNDLATCSWKFKYIGRNMTSNSTVYNNFKQNAGLVVNSTQELTKTIKRLVDATNAHSLSFSIGGDLYFPERNSLAVHKFSLTCPNSQVLAEEDYKCGKIQHRAKVLGRPILVLKH